MNRLTQKAALLLVTLLLSLGLASCGTSGDTATTGSQVSSAVRALNQPVSAAAAATPAATAATTGLPDVASVADTVRPATVLVLNLAPAQARGRAGSQTSSGTAVPQGAGTGFIIDASGVIVTNYHVVEGAQEVRVQLPTPDGRTFTATIVGTDPQTDLAVLKIDASGLPTVALGDSSTLRPGEWVVAIGNALALEGGPTVTAGVVSATGRDEQEPGDTSGQTGTTLYDLIQTDAAINPGNSGGPLVNLKGEVVGINTLGATDAQGIGFAISVNEAKPIIAALRQDGKVTRAYLGIQAQSVTAAIAAEQGLDRNDGVVIAQVGTGTPAAQGGLQAGDVITAIGDVTVKSQADLQHALTSRFKPGDTVTITIDRAGAARTIGVTLGEKPAADAATPIS